MLEFENDLTFYLLAAAGKYINRYKILDSLRICLVYLNMLQVSKMCIRDRTQTGRQYPNVTIVRMGIERQ